MLLVNAVPAIASTSANAAPHAPVCRSSINGNGNMLGKKRTVSEQLNRLARLQPGWDGGASAPISREALGQVQNAINEVKRLSPFERDPAIVPCADGSLQIEWHLEDSSFEMYFETDGSVSAWWHDRLSDDEWDEEGSTAFALLAHWAVRDAAWPVRAIAA